MSSGLLTIESVADNGGGSYTLTVEDSTGVVANDHLGARLTSASGPGAVYLVASVPTGTSINVTDTLTEESGGAFGPPIAGAGWFGTPSASGLSLIPHQAAPYDAAQRRNDYLMSAAAQLTVPIPVASGGTAAANAGDARTNLGLGTIATQAASAVAITGGTITGITDLAVADGGTGASTPSGARTNLGLVIGTNVQAHAARLDEIAAATMAQGAILKRGASAVEGLAKGAEHTVLKAGATDLEYSTVTALLDAVFGSTSGKVLQRGASAWEADDPPAASTPGLDEVLAADNNAAGASATGLTDLSATTVTAPTVRGSTSASGTLALTSTSHATKGTITAGPVEIDEANGRMGVGVSGPQAPLDVSGDVGGVVERKTATGSWTSSVAEMTRRRASTSGTPAAGFGISERTYMDGDGGGDDLHAATEEFAWTNVDTSTESADYALSLRRFGTVTEALRAVAITQKLRAWGQEVAYVDPGMAGGRLSVDSADPIGEGTSATLYYLPHVSSRIALYSTASTRWEAYTFTGPTLDVSALTADQVYDVFAYASGSTVTLEAVAWSSHGAGTSARATALTRQDGVLVKSGDATRRYLGTIRTVDDSGVKARDASQYRFVWNAQNRTPYADTSSDTTDSWTTSGTNGTWGSVNGGAAPWTHRFVSGASSARKAQGTHSVNASIHGYAAAVVLNWTSGSPDSTAMTAWAFGGFVANNLPSSWVGSPPVGYGIFQGIETATGATSPAVYGDNGADYIRSGMIVEGER